MESIPIRSPFPGAECFLVPVTDSTMDEARRLAAAGFPDGTVLAADRQTAGRGRFRDRSWTSTPGRDLTFTVLLPAQAARLPGFTLRAGLALHEAIEDYALRLGVESRRLKIKWPNDLLWAGRKVAGILCESSVDRSFTGVGVNCGPRPTGEGFRTATSGLEDELGAPVDRFRLLELFLERYHLALSDPDWRARTLDRLWLLGEAARFHTGLSEADAPGARTIMGTLCSLGEAGDLILETEEGPQSFVSGELSPLTLERSLSTTLK